MERREAIFVLLAIIFLTIALIPFASKSPDGLEKVASEKGFSEKADTAPPIKTFIPDYLWPGIKNEKVALSLSAIAGLLIVFSLTYAAALAFKKR